MLWEGVVFGVTVPLVFSLLLWSISIFEIKKKNPCFFKGFILCEFEMFLPWIHKESAPMRVHHFMRRTCCVPPRACPVLLSLIESVFVYFLFLSFESKLTEWPTSASLLLSHNLPLFSSFCLTAVRLRRLLYYTQNIQYHWHLIQNYMFINSNLCWIHKIWWL